MAGGLQAVGRRVLHGVRKIVDVLSASAPIRQNPAPHAQGSRALRLEFDRSGSSSKRGARGLVSLGCIRT